MDAPQTPVKAKIAGRPLAESAILCTTKSRPNPTSISTSAIPWGMLATTATVAVKALNASVRAKSQYVLLNTLFVLAILAAGSIVAAVEKTGLSLFMCRSLALDLGK